MTTTTEPKEVGEPTLVVRFVHDDADRVAQVAEWAAGAVARRKRVVLVATRAHLAAFAEALGPAADGVRLLDAHETLSSIMVEGHPDRARLRRVIGPHVTGGDGRAVCVYGEMVDVLLREGRAEAALELEEAWDQLRRAARLSVLCTYATAEANDARGALDRVRALSDELLSFVDHADIAIHTVGDDGSVLFANRTAVALFGRPRVDIVGKPLSAFFDDESIAGRIVRGETLVEVPARVRRPDGVRDVVITSHPRQREGALPGTACFLRDVTTANAHARRTETLLSVTTALAGAVSVDDVFAAVLEGRARLHGIAGAAVFVSDDDGATAGLARAWGAPPDGAAAARAMRDRRASWVDSQPRVAALPIEAGGRVLGALTVQLDDGPALDDDARHFLELVARYTGQALERLRLLEREKAQRRVAEARAARDRLLSRASLAFSQPGHDVEATLQAAVLHTIEGFADSCAVLLVEGEHLVLSAAADRDPAATAALGPTLRNTPLRVGEGIAGRVAQTGDSSLVNVDDPAALARPGVDPALARYFPRSILTAPLRVEGRIIGALSATRRALPAFDDDDRSLVEALAERAAAAIERSRLHEESQRARDVAERLYRLADAMNRAVRVEEVCDAAHEALAGLDGVRASIRPLRDAERRWPHMVGYAGPAPAQEPGDGAYGTLVAGCGKHVGELSVQLEGARALTPAESAMIDAVASHASAAFARLSLLDELNEGLRFNEIFTGMLGHELRNPLGTILTAGQLALRRADERVARPLERVISSGARMSRMIDQLLDFTRVRIGGGIPLHRTPTDLVPLVRAIFDEHEHERGERALDVHATGDTCGAWDADRLLQVFSNLVANAVRHGTGAVRVDVDGTDAARVEVRVHNDGAISEALLPRLFEPMTGGDARRDGSRGLGLGLYITRRIIEAHGGRIFVDSGPEQGTLFTIWLPRRDQA